MGRSLSAVSPLLAGALMLLVVIGAAWSCVRGGAAPAIVAPAASGTTVSAAGVGDGDGIGAFVLTAGRTVALAVMVSLLSVVLALPAAWSLRGRSAPAVLFVLTPMVLPQYLVYAAWGVARSPGTWLGDRLMKAGAPPAGGGVSAVWEAARWAQTTGGMALWAWPLAVLVLLPSVMRVDASSLDALRLSGAGPLARVRMVIGQVRSGLLVAIALVGLVMLGSAVPVHVAQIETWAIGVWRVLAETGGSAAAWRAGAPLMLVTGVGGVALAWRLVRADRGSDEPADIRDRASAWPLGLVWGTAVVVPAALLAFHLKQTSSMRRFWVESGEPLWFSAQIGLVVGVIVALVGASAAIGLAGPRAGASARRASAGVAIWAALAAVPGVLIGSALLSVSMGVPGMAWVTDSPAGLVLAHAARFGAVGALAGWWVARTEPSALRDTRLMLGETLAGWWMGVGRPGVGAIACAGIAAGMLSVHEIESGVVVSPPGVRTLSQHMLNLLHYLRDEQLTAGSLWMLVLGIVAAAAGLIALRASGAWRAAARMVPVLALGLVMVACGGHGPDGAASPRPLPGAAVLGETGKSPGQFVKPRCIDTDGERLFVIDMTGRCQVLSPKGDALAWWTMPAIDRGKPTGVTWFPGAPGAAVGGVSGPQVLVADSHENRVASYALTPKVHGSSEIPVAWQWGAYGHESGQFVFPSDVLVVPADGAGPTRVYVSEYGGNDRVNIFGVDGTSLGWFGAEGDSDLPESVRFRRPQSLLWDAPSRTLVVADACNHRLGLFTDTGKLKKWIGRDAGAGALPGQGLGEFHYPYGLCQLSDGTLLVAEQGNARVQRVDLTSGRGLAVYGRRGHGVGELDAPWGICCINDVAFVCDSGNHRLQSFLVPDVPWPVASRRGAPNGAHALTGGPRR